ncbi:MAG TPA: hypothetical protein VHV31_07495, partial [Nitrolancea sp.]|nr:hypothetical protein [Nitrolancea sp.]
MPTEQSAESAWRHHARSPFSLRGLTVVAEFEVRAIRNLKSGMLGQYVVEPLVWTALLAAGLMSVQHVVRLDSGREVEYLTFAFPGIVGILAMRGFSRTIYRCTIDRRWGLLALKVIYGTGPLGYVLGMTALPIVGLWIQM